MTTSHTHTAEGLAAECKRLAQEFAQHGATRGAFKPEHDALHAAIDRLAALAAPISAPAASQAAEPEPLFYGHWHHGNGNLCCGSMRYFRADFDTDPAPDVRELIFDWVCTTMNAALDRWRDQKRALEQAQDQPSQRVEEGDGELPVVAWLLTGGRLWGDGVCIDAISAEQAILKRKDDTDKFALVRLSDAQARIDAHQDTIARLTRELREMTCIDSKKCRSKNYCVVDRLSPAQAAPAQVVSEASADVAKMMMEAKARAKNAATLPRDPHPRQMQLDACFAAIDALGAAATQASPLGECDECGTAYSFDPTDGGSICVACLKAKLATQARATASEPLSVSEREVDRG